MLLDDCIDRPAQPVRIHVRGGAVEEDTFWRTRAVLRKAGHRGSIFGTQRAAIPVASATDSSADGLLSVHGAHWMRCDGGRRLRVANRLPTSNDRPTRCLPSAVVRGSWDAVAHAAGGCSTGCRAWHSSCNKPSVIDSFVQQAAWNY